MPKLPWYAKPLLYVVCLPVILMGCATVPDGPKVAHSFTVGVDSGKLFDAPCSKPKVLALIPLELRAEFRDAEATYETKPYDLCWCYVPDKSGVFLIWEDGNTGGLPNDVLRGGTEV